MARVNNYINLKFCVNCDENLTEVEVMYSMGRCPLCGHKGKNACTIVAVNHKAAKRVSPWWNIFTPRYQVVEHQELNILKGENNG